MNKNILKGNWKELKGKIKQQWAKLTDDDILQTEGSYDELCGILEKQYGYKKDQAKKEVNHFIDMHGLRA